MQEIFQRFVKNGQVTIAKAPWPTKKNNSSSEIVEQTDEKTLLDRLRSYGFWPSNEPLPEDPPDEVAEREKIQAELAQLRKTSSAVKNPQRALAQERKRRWEESKKRRVEAKKKRAEEEQCRREDWNEHCLEHVVHLGRGVSAGPRQNRVRLHGGSATGIEVTLRSAAGFGGIRREGPGPKSRVR